MMPHIIPGGRQRASSDGDVLEEEDDTILASGVLDRLNDNHRNVSRSVILSTEDRDSDDQRWSADENRTDSLPNRKKSLRKKISLKSVKKAVSRAFPLKDTLFGSSSSLPKEEMPTTVRASSAGVWTPTLRRKFTNEGNDRHGDNTHQDSRRSGRDVEMSGNDSGNRPLITDVASLICKWERTPGNVGIFNHGNTCFMNAVLQCLTHTDSFTEYFVADLYKDALRNSRNSSKKLGMKGSKGDVTEQLALLLKSLWSGKYNSEVSTEFKTVVGKYNSQYKGSSQHDAQEFLLWLLDRIHEDLIQQQPTQSKKKGKQAKLQNVMSPTKTMTDDDLAEAVESGLSSSFVSHLLQALHRSSLTCPHCNRHSNTFDPYLCVSLPLPQKCLRPIFVTVVTLNERPKEMTVGLNMNVFDTVKDLKEAVEGVTNIPAEQLVLCQLSNEGFCATYSNEQPLSDIPDTSTVYAIEMHPPVNPAGEDSGYETPTMQILVLHVEQTSTSWQRFCHPEVLRVSREISLKDLQLEILQALGEVVKQAVFAQRLQFLFHLQVVDGSSRKFYLSKDVDMPLYTQTVDRVLSMFGEEFGPQHMKLIAEWEASTKQAVIQDDVEHFVEHVSVNQVKSCAQQPNSTSLEECFKLYTQEEKLAGEDAWLCPYCKKAQEGATKILELWSLPDILVLHLKRFKQSGMRRNKLNALVNFPVENLDMISHVVQRANFTYKRDDMIYDLIGVCNHFGNMMGGHYTAFCKSSINGLWYEFDDRRVQSVTEDQVITKSAYILFYQRRSLTKIINQNLHTGTHWVFALQSQRISPEKPSSPRQKDGSGIKKDGSSSEEWQHFSPQPFLARRSLSKEWNGPPSPVRRPTIRPLTPQPQRRHTSGDLETFRRSQSSFRNRSTLSRQSSDSAARIKSQQGYEFQESPQKHAEKTSFSPSIVNQTQTEILQVQLPPKSANQTWEDDKRISSIIQKFNQEGSLPQKLPDTRSKNGILLQKQKDPHPKEDARMERHPSMMGSLDYYQTQQVQLPLVKKVDIKDPSVLLHHVDQGAQKRPNPPRFSQHESRSGRPWQYESQSSQSSHDTYSSRSSREMQSTPWHDHSSPKSSPSSDGDHFDWRQPEKQGDVLDRQGLISTVIRPISSGSPRTPIGKPPLPPKSVSVRVSDSGRAAEVVRGRESDVGNTLVLDSCHISVTVSANSTSSSPSKKELATPPSPAPNDIRQEIEQRSQAQAMFENPASEAQLTARDLSIVGTSLPQRSTSDVLQSQKTSIQQDRGRESSVERPIQRNLHQHGGQRDTHQKSIMQPGYGQEQSKHHVANPPYQLEQDVHPRRLPDVVSMHKTEPKVPDQSARRKQNQATPGLKFATIARGNRDTHADQKEHIPPAAVPRSSTDYNIHYRDASPGSSPLSSLSHRHSGSSTQNERVSALSGSYNTYSKDIDSCWEKEVGLGGPLYAKEQSSMTKENRHHIYRGPMFQRIRRDKTSEITAPHLRESSV